MTWQLIHADCIEAMQQMDEASVDAIVTDPPYLIGFMGRTWDRQVEQNWHHLWATEALRVLGPGAHLLAFGGTRTFHRLTCALEDAGFEIRDCLSWLYGSGFPKSLNLDGDWQGWGTALKPAWEPIVLARKPLAERNVASNVQRFGTGALNIDGARIGERDESKMYVVSLRLGRSFIGIELNPEYAEMARRRILDDAPLFNTPSEVVPREVTRS